MDEEVQNMLAEVHREEQGLREQQRIQTQLNDSSIQQQQQQQQRNHAFDSTGGANGPKGRFKPDADDRSICVLGLPPNVEVNDLGDFFSECGPIAKITKVMDKKTNTFKGMAYIEFETHEGAGRAVDQKNNAAVPGPNGPVNIRVSKKRSMFRPGQTAGAIGGAIGSGAAGRGRGGSRGGGFGGAGAGAGSSGSDMAAMAATMMAMMLQTQQQMLAAGAAGGAGANPMMGMMGAGRGGMAPGGGGGGMMMGGAGGRGGFGMRGGGMMGGGRGMMGSGPRGGGGFPGGNNNNMNNNMPQAGGNPFG